MRGLILAAGRGSRMKALTDHQPKCFAVLHGRRLLDWQVSALHGAGIEHVALVRGYCGEAFDLDLHYLENPLWATSNMVRTLLAADEWLSGEDCIVSYSDIVYTANTVAALAANPAALAIAYDPNWLALWSERFTDPLADAESFSLDQQGDLATIGERCTPVEQIQGQYMGLLKFTPPAWARIRQWLLSLEASDVDRLDMTTLLRQLLATGERIAVSPVVGPWGEVDACEDLELYHRLLSAQALAGGPQ